jgi:hypothetical protein
VVSENRHVTDLAPGSHALAVQVQVRARIIA